MGLHYSDPTRPPSLLLSFFRSKFRSLLTLTLLSLIAFLTLSLFGPLTKQQPRLPAFRPPHFPFAPTPSSPPRRLHPDDYIGEKLLSLPVLVTTSNAPFDDVFNGHKSLKNSFVPFNQSSDLYQRLRNPPESKPPPKPRWPSITSHQPRTPLPHSQIHNFKIASSSTLPPNPDPGNLPRVQWLGFSRSGWETEAQRKAREKRKEWVRNAFLHVWEGYKARAWGHDELKPISGKAANPFSGWGATLVDCLDTLLIMNLPTEYKYAREHVRTIDWSYTLAARHTAVEPTIPFFETVIRYVGGLISAYELSGDSLMLERAENLADWLLPAFGTNSGFPMPHYQIGTNPLGVNVGRVCLAEMGSLSLEFTRLAQITQKPHYFYYVQRITDHLDSEAWNSGSRLGSLFPTFIDPMFPNSLVGIYTFGGMADSYYEYLIKEHQLVGAHLPQYAKMYTQSISSARQHLIKTFLLEGPNTHSKKVTVIGDKNGETYIPGLDHLTCFSGAMIGLGAKLLENSDDLDLAVSHTDSCVWAYESSKTGLGPERMTVLQGDQTKFWEPVDYRGRVYRRLKANSIPGSDILDGRYLGRPETIESVFYMWRITGDRVWQDRGWRMFTSWMESCFTEFGFADLKDVNSDPPSKDDKQESFVLAETMKYYFLLFSDPSTLSLDEYVLNTEAHPFHLGPHNPPKEFKITGLDRFGSGSEGHDGTGTVLQAWSRADVDKLGEEEKAFYSNIMSGIS